MRLLTLLLLCQCNHNYKYVAFQVCCWGVFGYVLSFSFTAVVALVLVGQGDHLGTKILAGLSIIGCVGLAAMTITENR